MNTRRGWTFVVALSILALAPAAVQGQDRGAIDRSLTRGVEADAEYYRARSRDRMQAIQTGMDVVPSMDFYAWQAYQLQGFQLWNISQARRLSEQGKMGAKTLRPGVRLHHDYQHPRRGSAHR